ncbi:MAG: UDP-N-acetylmuramoyl-tripeptide--D-alanyl-D-alanine ligase, partial [Bacteroidaceae bacterium]|nr:UDP-N-acetylmuramoyl-tripeptide--D-alanyl-D-alanine ligase [Bacteroidaceae bacterium]
GAGFDEVWIVGAEFESTQCNFLKFKDIEEVKAAIAHEQPQHRYILIKGSNSVKLYQLPELL